MICPQCACKVEIGDWPWCPHGSLYERNARRFDTIVVWASNSDPEKYSYPGQSNEPVPEGYHRVEITNLAEADRFVSRVNGIEQRKAQMERDLNYQAQDAQTRQRRDDTLARIRGNARAEALFRAAREWGDRRRDEKRSRRSLDPHFHIDVLSYDSGHRNSYSGPETGWRETKK